MTHATHSYDAAIELARDILTRKEKGWLCPSCDEYTVPHEMLMLADALLNPPTGPSGAVFDAVQLSEARYYRESKEPIGILARAILRANGELK